MLVHRNMSRVVERTREESLNGRMACLLQSWIDHGSDEHGWVGSLIAV